MHCAKNQVSIPRKPTGNAGFTRDFPLVSIPATPGFHEVSIPWKELTAQIPEIGNPVETTGNMGLSDRKLHGNHWKPGVARKEQIAVDFHSLIS